MVGIIKEINGEKKIVPLTTDTGTGAPVGTLISQYKKKPLSGYLYCDGSTFDQNAYPALYMYLGTNVLPDYRECVMVGAEQNTTDTIATHDVYGEGEFKDDQFQLHNHIVPNSHESGTNQLSAQYTNKGFFESMNTYQYTGRYGDTTHGKQKAVYVYIKATSGLAENQQDNVLNDAKNYINNSNSYSTEEVKTGGTWIDGKPIYRKVVDVGTLPNATSKSVLHNIQNLNKILEAKLVANDSTNSIVCNFGGTAMAVYIDAANIITKTDNNFTGYSGYVIIEYTKTTD